MDEKTLRSISPVTGSIIAEYKQHQKSEVSSVISKVAIAGEEWSKTEFRLRNLHMQKASVKFMKNALLNYYIKIY